MRTNTWKTCEEKTFDASQMLPLTGSRVSLPASIWIQWPPASAGGLSVARKAGAGISAAASPRQRRGFRRKPRRREWLVRAPGLWRVWSRASRRRARSAGSRTRSSRSQGRRGCRATGSWAGGSGCGADCGRGGSQPEESSRNRSGSWSRPRVHLGGSVPPAQVIRGNTENIARIGFSCNENSLKRPRSVIAVTWTGGRDAR